jgi:plastocyanin
MSTRPRSITPTLAICTIAGLFAVAMLVGATIGNTPLTRPAAAEDPPRTDETEPDDSAPDDGAPDDTAAPGDGGGDTATIVIEDFDYTLPAVRAGEEVTVVNRDAALHSATDHGGAFESGLLGQDQSTTIIAPAAGKYELFCSLHPSMEVIWEVAP